MKQTFEPFCNQQLFPHEGGYVDHPRDPGGATNMGITLATLSKWRGKTVSKADVRALSRDEAMRIYRAEYWNKTGPNGADMMLAGPDAALFDVSVNSGVGRSRQWYPLTVGKSAQDAVKAVCTRRRSFFQSLKTFDTFGRGWMRRVNAVEAWALAWSYKAVGANPSEMLKIEAKKSQATVKKVDAGTAGTTGAVVMGAPAAPLVDWLTIAAVSIPILLAIGFLVYKSFEHRDRATAMNNEAENV